MSLHQAINKKGIKMATLEIPTVDDGEFFGGDPGLDRLFAGLGRIELGGVNALLSQVETEPLFPECVAPAEIEALQYAA